MILLIDIIEILSRFGTSARVKVSLAREAPRRDVKPLGDQDCPCVNVAPLTIRESLSNEADNLATP
jgi:hypothetical protein